MATFKSNESERFLFFLNEFFDVDLFSLVNIKWNKEIFKDIEVDSSLPPTVLKAQLFSLTNVPSERQKIMVKGQTIGDENWGKVTLTNGLTLLMMGSADPIPEVTVEKSKNSEISPELQIAQHLQFPGGLRNLGKEKRLFFVQHEKLKDRDLHRLDFSNSINS